MGGRLSRHGWQGLLLALVGLGFLASFVEPSRAAGRSASMAIDVNSGRVLHDQAADELRYPASLTKMMTLYVVFELMQQGRLSASTRITVSEEAAATAPSKLGPAPGAEIALIDAIKAVIVKSANDMSVAIAEHVSGSEAKFAALMTRRAKAIGMTQSTFRNAHGLPHPEQQTTARDMLTLAMRLSEDFPNEFKLFSARSMEFSGRSHRNHNTMLTTYRGTEGIKTGYTRASGFNLVSSVRRDGRHVVAAVFGGSSAAARNAQMRVLLDRSLARASTERTRVAAPRAPTKAARHDPRQRPEASDKSEPRLVEPPRQVAVRQPARTMPAASAPSPEAPALPTAAAERIRQPLEVQRVRTVAVNPEPAPVALPDMRGASNAWRPGPEPGAARMPATSPPPLAFDERPSAPSSLQAQAERIERGLAPVTPPAPVTVPQPRRAHASGGRNAIQVGAYSTEAEARRQLAAAREKSKLLLASAEAMTEPVNSGSRQLWRARFVGLDQAAAADACNQLRRARFDCMVAQVP
jgi:D-alanyl-D-alanine carboxypeptidase